VADEICAILGRELRAPVAAALKRARLAERRLRETDDPARARALVDAVNRAVQRLDAIITRIIRQARRPRRGPAAR
jgi:signal transduction histidine kinase